MDTPKTSPEGSDLLTDSRQQREMYFVQRIKGALRVGVCLALSTTFSGDSHPGKKQPLEDIRNLFERDPFSLCEKQISPIIGMTTECSSMVNGENNTEKIPHNPFVDALDTSPEVKAFLRAEDYSSRNIYYNSLTANGEQEGVNRCKVITSFPSSERCIPGNGCRPHKGIDIDSLELKKPFLYYPFSLGKVLEAENSGSGSRGKYVVIELLDKDEGSTGVVISIFHAAGIYTQEGDILKKGDKFAAQGNTGRSTGTHVHIEAAISKSVTHVEPDIYKAGDYETVDVVKMFPWLFARNTTFILKKQLSTYKKNYKTLFQEMGIEGVTCEEKEGGE